MRTRSLLFAPAVLPVALLLGGCSSGPALASGCKELRDVVKYQTQLAGARFNGSDTDWAKMSNDLRAGVKEMRAVSVADELVPLQKELAQGYEDLALAAYSEAFRSSAAPWVTSRLRW